MFKKQLYLVEKDNFFSKKNKFFSNKIQRFCKEKFHQSLLLASTEWFHIMTRCQVSEFVFLRFGNVQPAEWERLFGPEKLRPDNEMLSEARNIACDTQRRTNYDNVLADIILSDANSHWNDRASNYNSFGPQFFGPQICYPAECVVKTLFLRNVLIQPAE